MNTRPARDRIYVVDLVEAGARIMTYTHGMTQGSFVENRLVLDAVVRNFEVMGEAAKRVSEDLRQGAPQIPWRQIAGFRDVLIHGYDRVAPLEVWRAIELTLPPVLEALAELIKDRGWK